MTKEKFTGLIITVIGLLIAIGTYQMKVTMLLAQGDPGPKLFLYIAAIGLTMCGLGMVATSKDDKKMLQINKEELKRFTFLFAILVLYCAGLHFVGFIISTPIALATLVYILKMEKKVSLIGTIIFSIVFTAFLYILFRNFLSIILPEGILLENIL